MKHGLEKINSTVSVMGIARNACPESWWSLEIVGAKSSGDRQNQTEALFMVYSETDRVVPDVAAGTLGWAGTEIAPLRGRRNQLVMCEVASQEDALKGLFEFPFLPTFSYTPAAENCHRFCVAPP